MVLGTVRKKCSLRVQLRQGGLSEERGEETNIETETENGIARGRAAIGLIHITERRRGKHGVRTLYYGGETVKKRSAQ